MKLLDRYVFTESIQLLVIGSMTILGIFFGTAEFQTYMNMMNDFGFPFSVVLSVMFLQIPTGISFCLPAGVLFSTMFLLIRQQDDSEILALLVSGVSMKRIMAPYIMFGLVAALITFSLNEYVSPQTRLLSEKLSLIALYKTAKPFAGRFKLEQKDDKGNITKIFCFGEELGRSVNGLLLIDLTEKSSVKVVWAQKGTWNKGSWCLTEGQNFDFFNTTHQNRVARFGVLQYENPGLFKAIKAGPLSTLSKTTEQIRDEIASYKNKQQSPPADLIIQLYRRYSHPASCVLLVLAATPVALMRARRSRSTAFVYAGIVIATYFVLQQICTSLAENSQLTPFLGSWLPSIVLCLFGLMVSLLLSRR